MSIPPGFVQCETCGDYKGTTQSRYLVWGITKYSEAELNEPVSVSCLCRGSLCIRCKVNKVHRSGSNTYDPLSNSIGHNPWFAGMIACESCRDEQQAKYPSIPLQQSATSSPLLSSQTIQVCIASYRSNSRLHALIEEVYGDTSEARLQELFPKGIESHIRANGQLVYRVQWPENPKSRLKNPLEIYTWANRYWKFCTDGVLVGPYRFLKEASPPQWFGDQSVVIQTNEISVGELVQSLIFDASSGLVVTINGEGWKLQSGGILEKMSGSLVTNG